ncbi:hypothetical protein ACICHK_27990 [Streptomyces sp. AHU1]|uniref:hypothetical protein n=1 Tax=Streptomyces TaxID=1883 RepID=UPI001F0CD6A0|nr:hypothetical protein [Streptomyces populi]
MNLSSAQLGVTAVWLLVAVLLAIIVALVASLLKIKEGAGVTAIVTSAAVAFGGAMGLLVVTFSAVGLLRG